MANRHPNRKLVRAAMREALSDPVNGFNAVIAEFAEFYEVEPFVIDWDIGSENFLQSYVEHSENDQTRLIRDIRVALYTSLAQQSSGDAEATKDTTFWGEITGHFDVMVEYSAGVELTEYVTEEIADLIEEAVLAIIVDPRAANAHLFRSGPIYYSGDFACPREVILNTSEGYMQRLPFNFIFEVHS